MNIELTVLNNHTVKQCRNRCIGVKGDHLTNTLVVTLNCEYKYTTAKLHFEKPNGETECSGELAVTNNTVAYPLPYPLFMESGSLMVSVTATTAEGKVLTSKAVEYVVYDSVHGTKPIEDKIAALEAEVEELKKKLYKNSVLGICELNYMILGMEA